MKGIDILTSKQFNREQLDLILKTAEKYEEAVKAGQVIRDLEGLVVATLFFEPSTRTRLSFETAANRLSARVITVSEPSSSSISKGETLEDMIRVVDGYADVIVMRNPVKGSAQVAADNAVHPVINAGDGAGQHPTQALLDLYTIVKERGGLSNMTVTMLGDLKFGRTVHSLSYFMALYGNRMIFASPESLKMPEEITRELRDSGAQVEETGDVEAALAQSDIVYVTRVQRERFSDPAEYEKVKGGYILDGALLAKAKPGITILHPLPRVGEIATEVDDYSGAAYFRQAHNGLYVRMALLGLVTGRAA
ncbi:MAG: aspartate carbamoyltransferase [Actinobacteria bacterium]|nr:aspartate carbamoyltransferase [Actinomycetota bacterium]